MLAYAAVGVLISLGVAGLMALAGLRIANQYERAVVFTLGRYRAIKGPGLYWLIPVLEWQSMVDLRLKTAAVEQQEAITRDNVPVQINAVVWYRTIDPRAAVIEVGGFAADSIGEDFELCVRLHRKAREERRRYRLEFVPDPVCWTEVPERLRDLGGQRSRWHRGLVDTLWRHRRMIGNPRYGVIGMGA